jgi:hypothetical protein
MTKTCIAAMPNLFANPDFSAIIQLGLNFKYLAVWNFEFGYWDLFDIWLLVLGIFWYWC